MNQLNLIGPKAMSELLGVPISWLYQRTRFGSKAIPHVKLGKYVRFDPNEVKEFFKNKEIK